MPPRLRRQRPRQQAGTTRRHRRQRPRQQAGTTRRHRRQRPRQQAGIEALIRDQIEANAATIRACTNNETTVIEVTHAADRTTISLLGKHAGTPAEGCVRVVLTELARLKAPNGDSAPVTVRHPIVAK
jgi:hypothetical protein